MERKRQTRQSEYTQRVIKEAFVKLLKKRPIEKISVGELCEMAGINRSTFYRRYADIYALLDAFCDEYFELLYMNIAAQYDPDGQFEANAEQLILQGFAVTEQHKDIYRLLLCDQPSARLLYRLTDAMYQHYKTAHEEAYPSSPDADIHYRFLVSGILGLWQSWLMEECRWPKEKLAEAVKLHIGGFFHTMGNLYGKPKNYKEPK